MQRKCLLQFLSFLLSVSLVAACAPQMPVNMEAQSAQDGFETEDSGGAEPDLLWQREVEKIVANSGLMIEEHDSMNGTTIISRPEKESLLEEFFVEYSSYSHDETTEIALIRKDDFSEYVLIVERDNTILCVDMKCIYKGLETIEWVDEDRIAILGFVRPFIYIYTLVDLKEGRIFNCYYGSSMVWNGERDVLYAMSMGNVYASNGDHLFKGNSNEHAYGTLSISDDGSKLAFYAVINKTEADNEVGYDGDGALIVLEMHGVDENGSLSVTEKRFYDVAYGKIVFRDDNTFAIEDTDDDGRKGVLPEEYVAYTKIWDVD